MVQEPVQPGTRQEGVPEEFGLVRDDPFDELDINVPPFRETSFLVFEL